MNFKKLQQYTVLNVLTKPLQTLWLAPKNLSFRHTITKIPLQQSSCKQSFPLLILIIGKLQKLLIQEKKYSSATYFHSPPFSYCLLIMVTIQYCTENFWNILLSSLTCWWGRLLMSQMCYKEGTLSHPPHHKPANAFQYHMYSEQSWHNVMLQHTIG